MIGIFHGDDTFRRQRAIQVLKRKLLQPGFEAINFLVMDNPPIEDFCSVVGAVPMGLGEKLIVINEARFLEQKIEKHEQEKLLNAIDNLPENVSIIFNSNKINQSSQLIKTGLKTVIESYLRFSTWDFKKAASWLLSMTDELQVTLDEAAAEYFTEYLGCEDSSKLYSELQRLSVLQRIIDIELINRECTPKYDVFRLAKLMSEKNFSEANKELTRIFKAGEANLGLLALLQTNIGRYLKLKLLDKEKTLAKDAQAKVLGVTPQRLYFLKKEVETMSLDNLISLNSKLTGAERKIKRGEFSVDLALRLLVN